MFPDFSIISSIGRSTADNYKNREQPGTGNSLAGLAGFRGAISSDRWRNGQQRSFH
jgi:hypothetical protein